MLPADSSQPKVIMYPASQSDVMPPAATTTNTGRQQPGSGDLSQKPKDVTPPETGKKAVKLSPEVSGLSGKVEISAIEKAVATLEKGGEKPAPQPYQAQMLSQFGYSFFRPEAAGFASLTDIPVGPDYVIGPGDRIVLNLWGSVEGTHELEVNRSGEIILPRVGGVKVWGLTFARLPEVLKTTLSKVFKDFDLNVTMGKLRVIKVFVVGEVTAPGDYNLTSLSTLINALSAAGGPLKSGTLRNVQVKRAGKVVETVDLYDFFLKGDKSRDIRLQPGDTIFVPVLGRVAAIAGNVRRPAIYELKEERNLVDLIALAEGLLPTGYLQRVQISRIVAHDKNVVADFNIDPKDGDKSLEQLTRSIAIQDMDVVKIFPINRILRGHVQLNGYVLRPGDYALQPGMRLSSLLLPDNLLPEYYREAAEVTRYYPPDDHPEIFFVNLAKAVAGDPVHDTVLKEFDRVKVFSRWEMEEKPVIRINGEVQRPGEYRLFPNMTVRDLIMEAGNLKITAYTRNAEINRITRTGEKAKSFPIIINLEEVMKGNPKDNLALNPFDELTIRKIPNWADEKERYVTLVGEFQFPGVYPIYKGERLSSVIQRSGGFTDKAYPRGAKFTRESVRVLQQQRMDEAIERAQEIILSKKSTSLSAAASKEELDATKASLDSLERSIAMLKTKKAEGRMIITLTSAEKLAESPSDVELNGGDVLQVPSDPKSVNVLGSVYNPTTALYEPLHTVGYYLDKVGGPTNEGDTDEMYMVKADGTVISTNQSSSFLFFNGFYSINIDSGDTIVVPQKLERTAWLREIKDITTIISQIAISAGTVFLGLR
ncbi:MAG: SLBB domain-containing protein [Desulfuromonadales bacterium]|nr:SLBB domain-containing protein [Desulfuromonadales bacterium]